MHGSRSVPLPVMELPPPDPRKLLDTWMEWEAGETTPGRIMADLKTGGLPRLLQALVEGSESAPAGAERA